MAPRKHEPGPTDGSRQYATTGRPSASLRIWGIDACRHQAVIDVSSYPGDMLVPVVPVQGEVRQLSAAREGTISASGHTGKRNRACPTAGKGARPGITEAKGG